MKKSFAAVLLVSFLTVGCAPLSPVEEVQYKNLEKDLMVAQLEDVQKKNPGAAAALNLLPGFGNLYIGQPGYFAGNLLLWPFSVLWGIPQAAIDAENINKKHTLAYYQYGEGKEILASRLNKAVPAEKADSVPSMPE